MSRTRANKLRKDVRVDIYLYQHLKKSGFFYLKKIKNKRRLAFFIKKIRSVLLLRYMICILIPTYNCESVEKLMIK